MSAMTTLTRPADQLGTSFAAATAYLARARFTAPPRTTRSAQEVAMVAR